MMIPFRYFNSSPEIIRLTVMIYIRNHFEFERHLSQTPPLQPVGT
jgi:hypothetical protein